MKIDLITILKELGLPVGLVALFSAVLGLFDVELGTILLIAGGLVGTFALIALAIDVLKWAGVVNDGAAGKWSAAANLVVVVSVAVIFKLYPQFDFTIVDAQIGEFARVAGILFAYVIQLVGSKRLHAAVSRGLSISAFSHSSA